MRGRALGALDDAAGARVAVVNETLAESFWPGDDPIGKRLRFKNEKELWEVVGVARNGKYRTLGETPRPYLYRTVAQTRVRDRVLLVRVAGELAPVLTGLRNEIRHIDPKVPIIALRPVEETVSVVLLLPRAGAALFGLFGVLGLLLASVGLYGVIAYMVGQRTREIGIRVALGADRQNVLKLVMGRGLALTAIGVALGLTGALGVTRILSVLLYGISPKDPLTFAGVSILLMLIAAAACFIPARKALRVDPVVALRYE